MTSAGDAVERPERGPRPCDAAFPTPPAVPDDSRHAGQAQLSKSVEPSVRSAPGESGWAEGADYAAHGFDDQDALNA